MAIASTIKTDKDLTDEIGRLAGGQQGNVPEVDAVNQTITTNDKTLDTTTGKVLGTDPTAATEKASTTGLTVTAPTAGSADLGQIDSTTNIGDTGTATAAQITPAGDYVDMTGVEGKVSSGSLATAATQELDQKATTKYQLEQLLSSVEDGTEMPAWASPAVRKVGAIMQARGLGASSMASAAITQAVMESGVVIAQQDANKYATIQLQNLNNQQQTALSNAATYASMDKANLSARLQGAVTNAQALLSVDTKNLEARQQSSTISYNALTQKLFKDAAEDNARKQFNAKNELQVDEFFAELEAQVETANKNRVSAMNQFNAGEANAQNQFNATVADARDKFNANMQFAVDQSNVNWRRQVNTANTATQNETNRINAQNLYNANQNALNNLWQKYRDNASWNFQKGESLLQRQHEVGIMAMEFANSKELYTKEQKDNFAAGVGNWIAQWMNNTGAKKST
tara:strand:- start:8337 stop:9710 length:1374 start_codon:yes stop_codon:yes gene_type:complete